MATPSDYPQSRRYSDLPNKLRRRQSDAKWRANVASCYETLKLIIPVNKRASKRQISKAHILQQTEKHIHFLEDILSSLLLEKAKKDGVRDVAKWKESKVKEVKEQFAEVHRQKINPLNVEKRYKKKSYKLFIPDEMMHKNIQQTAQLRTALMQKSRDLQSSSSPGEDDDGEYDKENDYESLRAKATDHHVSYALDEVTDSAANNIQEYYDIEPLNLYGAPSVVRTHTDIKEETLQDIINQSDISNFEGGCTVMPSSNNTVRQVQHTNINNFKNVKTTGRQQTAPVYSNVSDLQEVPALERCTMKATRGDTIQQLDVRSQARYRIYSAESVQSVPRAKPPLRTCSQGDEQIVPGITPQFFPTTKLVEMGRETKDRRSSFNKSIGRSQDENLTPISKTPVKRCGQTEVTPSKVYKKEGTRGFTPVKLPTKWQDMAVTSPCYQGNHVQQRTPGKPSPSGLSPYHRFNCNNRHQSCMTPIKPSPIQLSPSEPLPTTPDSVSLLEGIDSDEEGLLCTEEMWLSDEDNDDVFARKLEATPCHGVDLQAELQNLKRARLERSFRDRFKSTSSQRSSCSADGKQRSKETDASEQLKQSLNKDKLYSGIKCRRNLQSLYDNHVTEPSVQNNKGADKMREMSEPLETKNSSSTGNEVLDFDGYLQFYKKMGQCLEKQGHAEKMSDLTYYTWQQNKHIVSLKQLPKDNIPTSSASSQDSGIENSSINLPELKDFDDEVWPIDSIYTDIDLNATDEPYFPVDLSLVTALDGSSSQGPASKKGAVIPSLSNNSTLKQRATKPLILSRPTRKEKKDKNDNKDVILKSLLKDDNNTSDVVQPLIVLDKQLWLQPESSTTVDEELNMYLAEFSPPSKSNLEVT